MTRGADPQHGNTKRGMGGDPGESLLRAARAGDLKKVVDLINSGIDINSSNATGLTALHLAAKEGHTAIVRELIQHGANVNATSKKGNTALHIASLAGHLDAAKALLDANANPNCQSVVGFTPLYMAAQENHLDVVVLLLNRGANQSLTTEDGFTPLAVALQQGHDRVVATLLEKDTRSRGGLPALHVAARKDDVNAATLLLMSPDANVNHQSQPGFTALHIASHYGSTNVANLLIQRGADVNFPAKNNITPLHVAAKWGKVGMVRLLLDNGALVDSKTRDGLRPLHCAARSGHNNVCTMLIDAGCDPSAKTRNGLTPLHMAAQGNHEDVTRNLISRGANLQATTGDFLNALHVAAHCGNVNVARILIEKGCDMNARALNGFTPLHIACKKNKLPVVELLIKHGAQISSTTEAGLTPLHVAAFIGSPDLVRLLLQHGASVEQTTMRGETPLHLGARSCRVEVAELLLTHGAAVDARAKDEQTPLHIATLCGCTEMVYLLLKFGANPNTTTRDAYTALHIAAKDGRSECVQCLLASGADPDARTKRGFSPLHLAAKRGRAEAARTLLQVLKRPEQVSAVGRNGLTPLHMATHYNHLKLVQLLLEFGAEADRAADNGYTALHIAARRNHGEVASLLLANDNDPKTSTNRESKSGFTPLHLAAQEGNSDMVGLLLLSGAEADHKAKNGVAPLHLAALEDHVTVAQQLVQACPQAPSATTQSGYTPLHTACYAGRLNAARFLVAADRSTVNAVTMQARFTPLHLAAQQGHSDIVYLLLEHGADPNARNTQGLTAAELARHQHYLAIFDTLRAVTTSVKNWEETQTLPPGEELVIDLPEMLSPSAQETTEAVESDDEGSNWSAVTLPRSLDRRTAYVSQYQAEQVTPANEAQQLAAKAGAIPESNGNDVIWGEMEYLSQPLQEQVLHESSVMQENSANLSATLSSDLRMSEASKVLVGPGDHLDADWEMETEPALGPAKKPLSGGPEKYLPPCFLVSFLVDARGGLLESKRYPGLRFIIPPNASIGPLRIICRLLRYPSYSITPPLNDGEGLACRLIEVGPMGVHFNAPILIEVPYCASVRTNQREIVVLRSENGEVWKEHPVDPSDHAVQDSLGQYFADAIPSNELRKRRVHRILTTSFPQYFALVTRPKQDLILVGPEGSNLTSSLDSGVQVSFPRGALQKRIRVGLQVQNVDQCLVAACLGSPRITVSPIVTIEPRRRKFHRPISVFIPLPASTGASASEAEEEHRTNEKGGKDKHKNARDLSTLRLLCSITGGTQPAIWEDITGSSPFKLHKDCVSFTTTVSARLWLIDCPSLSEVSEMAARVYREASAVPYLGRFVVYARRHHPEEAQVRALCLTDDSEQKTLECQEGFEVVARTEDLVEFLHNRPVWLETAGNVVPVAPAASSASMASAEGGSTDDHQPRFASVRAFEENRMNVVLRIKDVNAPPAGQLAFMPRQRQPGGDSVEPLSVLDIVLPRMADSMMVGGTPSVQRQSTMQGSGMATTVENFFNGSARQESSEDECRSVGHRYGKCRLIESIARSDLDIKKVASGLDADWVRLAPHLGLSQSDIDQIRGDGLDSEYKKALTCLTMWQEKSGPAATGTALAHALKRLGREDVLRQSMQNVSLVQSGPELSHALQSLDATDSPRQRRVVGDRSTEADDAVMKGPHSTEAEGYEEEDVVTAITRNVDDGVLEATIVPPAAMAQPRGQSQASAVYEAEKKSALEELAQSLIEEDSRVPTVPPVRQDSGEGVHEEELVPATVPHGIVVQSAVPAFVNEEIERQEWNSSLESPRESSTVIIAAGGPGPTSSSDVDDTTSATEAGDATLRAKHTYTDEEDNDGDDDSQSYVANPLLSPEPPVAAEILPPQPPLLSSTPPFNSVTTNLAAVINNVPLTPIPEVSEFSLRSSLASTAATGPMDGSNGSLSRLVSRRLREGSPAHIRPPGSLRSSLENNPLDLVFEGLHRHGSAVGSGALNSPSSYGSSSLNEFLRLEEQESLSDDLEKQLMEGQEGDRSLVESMVGEMRHVEEEAEAETSLSRSLGPSIQLGTDSMSMLSTATSSGDIGPSFTSLSRTTDGAGGGRSRRLDLTLAHTHTHNRNDNFTATKRTAKSPILPLSVTLYRVLGEFDGVGS